MPGKHCDDYIDDPTQPECLRKFLTYARSPAHGYYLDGPKPTLFATYNEPDGPGGRKGKCRRVRVTMASRLGHVGITSNLERHTGYDWGVSVSDLCHFSEQS